VTRGGPRAVVFDLDDTLYRIRRFTIAGYAATSELIARQVGLARAQVFCRLQRLYRSGRAAQAYQELAIEHGLGPEEAAAWLVAHRAHRRRLRLPVTSVRVLDAMRREGWRVGLLTNGIPVIQHAKIAALDLAGRVDAIVVADEHVAGGKPAAEVFGLVLERLATPPSRAVMVGDDPRTDIAGGRAAGLRTIRVVRPNRSMATSPTYQTSPGGCWREHEHGLHDCRPARRRRGAAAGGRRTGPQPRR
jgi:putative hydrolase of the HAD superfamily